MYDELDVDPPEREISNVELQNKNSDESGRNEVSNSSFLSDGWCISISGKPCANLKIYQPDNRNSDTIGNLFSGGRHSKENLVESGVVDENLASEIEDQKLQAVDPGNDQTPRRGSIESARNGIASPDIRTSVEEGKNWENSRGEEPAAVFEKRNIDPNSTNSISIPKKESPILRTKNTQEFETRKTDTDNIKQFQKIADTKINPAVSSPNKSERRFSTEDGTVIYIGCNRSGKHSKSNDSKSYKNNVYCDENCQTCRPSILKTHPTAKSGSSSLGPCPGKRHQRTSTGAMDARPVKDTKAWVRSQKEDQQIVTTSDKILQTSDDRICFFRCGRDSASNTEQTNVTDSYVNTINSESTRVQTSDSAWSSPENKRCCYCSNDQKERVCSCLSPNCRSRLIQRRLSFSSLDTSPRTVDSYPLNTRCHVPRKKSPRAAIKYFNTSEASTGYICVPPCEGYKKLPFKAKRFQKPKSPSRQAHPKVPCDGSCRRSSNAEPYQNYRPFRPPPPPIQCEFSSSDEFEVDEGDEEVDGFTSDGSRRHDELPYQNNEEYLELVHELEETLQNRNRNRVRRAMKEFENKSKYNRPLEKPIIDYEEPSESEEPIIRRISELNEKRIIRCQGDCCGCRKEEQPNCQSKQNRPTSKNNKYKKHPRWQQDNKSGEWYKIGETIPPKLRMPPKTTPRGHIEELPCGCACKCNK